MGVVESLKTDIREVLTILHFVTKSTFILLQNKQMNENMRKKKNTYIWINHLFYIDKSMASNYQKIYNKQCTNYRLLQCNIAYLLLYWTALLWMRHWRHACMLEVLHSMETGIATLRLDRVEICFPKSLDARYRGRLFSSKLLFCTCLQMIRKPPLHMLWGKLASLNEMNINNTSIIPFNSMICIAFFPRNVCKGLFDLCELPWDFFKMSVLLNHGTIYWWLNWMSKVQRFLTEPLFK